MEMLRRLSWSWFWSSQYWNMSSRPDGVIGKVEFGEQSMWLWWSRICRGPFVGGVKIDLEVGNVK